MPIDVPKAGSVSALRQAFSNREAQAQADREKPATFRTRPVTPRSLAQTRIAAPPRQSPSPPPSRLAEARYGQKTVITSSRPSTPTINPAQPAAVVTSIPVTPSTPVAHQTPLHASRPVYTSIETTPALTPSDVTIQGFGRRETKNFEWPAGPKTDYAYEHHRRHSISSLDASTPRPLIANPKLELHHVNDTRAPPVGDKPPSRLKRLSEAASNSPLAKFRRTDTRKMLERDASVTTATIASISSTCGSVTPMPTNSPLPAISSPMSGPLSNPVPHRQVHDRIAVIEAAAHDTTAATSETHHQPITPFFSSSDRAILMPGAFIESDTSYFPKQPARPAQSQVNSPPIPEIVTNVPVAALLPSSSSPAEVTTPVILFPVAVPYFECPSPVEGHTQSNEQDELTRVGQVLDKIVIEHRTALEEVIARLSKELHDMKDQYDAADIPKSGMPHHTQPATLLLVNKVPEDELKVERHDFAHYSHLPEPYQSIVTLAPKIQEQTSILLSLMRQIKEVAVVWSVDLEQIQAVTDYPTMHRAARTLTRYAGDSPRPLNWWNKKKVRFADEVDEGTGWDQGYGVRWGFDGHGGWLELEDCTHLFDMSKKVLCLLHECDELLASVSMEAPGTADVFRQQSRSVVSNVDQGLVCRREDDSWAGDDIVDLVELYN